MPGSIIKCNTCYIHIYKDTENGKLTAVRGCTHLTDEIGEPEREESSTYNLGKKSDTYSSYCCRFLNPNFFPV